MTKPLQIRNDEQVALLSSDFQSRYESNFAWKSACSAFLALPGLRGFWPMSSFNENGNAYDMSGQGRILTYNGNPTYNHVNLIPYIDFDGTGDFLSRADEAGLDIIGTETYVGAKGLTLGGWFWVDQHITVGDGDGLIAKITYAGNQISYGLATDDVPNALLLLSSTGAVAGLQSVIYAITYGSWHFIVGRFTPSTELKIWVNDNTSTFVAAVMASIFNSTADLEIGAYNAGGNLSDGRASMAFLSTMALSDSIISALFQQTRAMFGR